MHIDRAQIYQSVRRRLRNRRFLHDSGLLLLANVLVTGLSVIRTPAITWSLSKDDVGMIGVINAWLPLIHLLSLPGMDSASYHYAAKGDTWAFAHGLWYRLRWSLLSMAGFCAGAFYWLAQGNRALFWMFLVTALTYPVTVGLNSAGNMLAAREYFTALFWYRIVQSLTDFVGFIPLLLTVWWINQALTFYTANQLATAIIQIGLSWWLLRHFRRMAGTTPTPAAAQEMVRYGKHQTGITSISVVRSQADSFLVSAYFPLAVIADYSLATFAQAQMKQLWTIYISVRYPPLVRMNTGLRWRRFITEGAIITLGFAGLAVVLGVVAMWLIPWLLPSSYVHSLPYIYWLLATFVISMPGFFAEAYFRTEQEEKEQYVMQAIAALLGVVVPLILLLRWQMQGLLVGRALASLGFSLVGAALFWRARPRLGSETR